ncbi:MAG: tripartite tricarboxylate transporter substrate binding protein BugE [Proteobacteria bacterium]|nr:tripartite tricarboxylate transporter substrate binding protein BugE [Pseudomonadota bacterium]
MSFTRRLLLATTAVVFAAPAFAQAYPNKPVVVVVPFAPGGTTDIITRHVAAKVQDALGQPMIVENKGGAGGAIGANQTKNATPDGYQLGVGTVSTTATVPAIDPKAGYNPTTDFTPIINMALTPNVIAVHPSFPAKDYKGFIAELKKNPTKYAYASSGAGGIGHLQTELFKQAAGVEMTHIPYKGAGPALNDVVAGQVLIMFDNLPSAIPHIRSGKLIPIVIAAPERLKDFPDVPTFKELGMEQVNRPAYYGILGPKGLPQEVVDKVNAAVKKTLADPDVKKKIEDTGSLILANSPAEFKKQIDEEYATYKKVVTEKGLKPE